jgi:hypothetical protein
MHVRRVQTAFAMLWRAAQGRAAVIGLPGVKTGKAEARGLGLLRSFLQPLASVILRPLTLRPTSPKTGSARSSSVEGSGTVCVGTVNETT